MNPQTPRARPRKERRTHALGADYSPPPFKTLVITASLVVLMLYALVVTLHATGGTRGDAEKYAVSEKQIELMITPSEVDAAGDRLIADLSFREGGLMTAIDGLSVMTDLEVYMTSEHSGQELSFEANRPIAPTKVSLNTTGSIELWPFDRHEAQTMVDVYRPAPNSGAPVGADDAELAAYEQSLPAVLTLGDHDVPGWSISLRSDPELAFTDPDSGAVVQTYLIEAQREPATIVFGIVLLGLMVMLPVLGLTVAIQCLRGKLRAEPAFFTWNAGMLFATPTLRNFLPGQPPVGSWVDYLVVLWVIAGLILALLFSVVAWYRQRTAEPEPQAAAPPQPQTLVESAGR
ncbi:DUF4436 family protein [Leucobacter sp. GX0328]